MIINEAIQSQARVQSVRIGRKKKGTKWKLIPVWAPYKIHVNIERTPSELGARKTLFEDAHDFTGSQASAKREASFNQHDKSGRRYWNQNELILRGVGSISPAGS